MPEADYGERYEDDYDNGYDDGSAQIVTPFVRVGTYPTRNFATLGPL